MVLSPVTYTFEVFEFDMEASLSTPTISPTKKKILATVTVEFNILPHI